MLPHSGDACVYRKSDSVILVNFRPLLAWLRVLLLRILIALAAQLNGLETAFFT